MVDASDGQRRIDEAAALGTGVVPSLGTGTGLSERSVARLAAFCQGRRLVVLTGAGCSTESGIPDYRGPETRRRARSPMKGGEFVGSADARQRYWARAAVGWHRIASAQPNAAHHALAELEATGAVLGLITQNVDRLHRAAGSRRVVELHGALADVRCLACGLIEDREDVQQRLWALNPDWRSRSPSGPAAPDGDADLDAARVRGFRVASCVACGGVLKPDVVFFGETCRPSVVAGAWQLWNEADALLVVGSSLAVFSGYRFVLKAKPRKLPVAIINLGPTRGDPFAELTLDARAGDLLPALVQRLGYASAAG